MKTCTKCGSSNLKFLDRQAWSGIRMERYKCLDCGQIQADDLRPRGRNAPKMTPEAKESFWFGLLVGVLIMTAIGIALVIIPPLLTLRFR